MIIDPPFLIRVMTGKRLNLESEKQTQQQLYVLLNKFIPTHLIKKEYELDKINRIDFMIAAGIGIEVKLKQGKRKIFKQVERYCAFDDVKSLILVTNTSIGMPKQINGKDIYVFQLSKQWL